MKKKMLVFATVIVVMGLCATVALWRSNTRGKLPLSATEVNVYSKSYGVQGWVYCLKAKLPEADFQKYASRLGVQPLGPEYHPDIHWQNECSAGWWNPTPATGNTDGCENGMGLDILMYENGYVYFKSTGS